MCAVPIPLPEVTECCVLKTVCEETNECKHESQGRSSVVTSRKARGMLAFGRAGEKTYVVHQVHHFAIICCFQGQMGTTCFARVDSEIATIF